MAPGKAAEHVLSLRVTQAKDRDLSPLPDDVARGLGNDVQSLLMHQSGDDAE